MLHANPVCKYATIMVPRKAMDVHATKSKAVVIEQNKNVFINEQNLLT